MLPLFSFHKQCEVIHLTDRKPDLEDKIKNL